MFVEVTGPNGGKVPQNLRITVANAIDCFTKELGINRMSSLELTIRVHNKATIDDHAEGYCEYMSPRKYVIDVCLFTNWISILAHEMVHVKQYIRKELSPDCRRWKSKKISSKVAYWDQPWEKEAFRLQKVLADAYDNYPL